MPYIPYESELFVKQWKVLCRKDKPLEVRLKSVLNAIIEHPENFDGTLKGDRQRSVKKKAISEHYRIVYRYCERCLSVHKSACDGCEGTTFIIFEEVFHRDDGY